MRDERWRPRAAPLPDGGPPVEWWIAAGQLSAEPVGDARELPGPREDVGALATLTAVLSGGRLVAGD